MISAILLCALFWFCLWQWFRTKVSLRLLQAKYDADMKLMNARETANREAYRWASARDVAENQRLRVELDALKRQQLTTAN